MNLNDTLTDMTVAELRKLAARFDITGRSKMAKAQLVRELADPDIADVVELAISVTETEEILADEDAVAAIEEFDINTLPDPDGSNTLPVPDGPWFDEDDAETMDDLRALLANAEADAECDRARRLAEYDAEEEVRGHRVEMEQTGSRAAQADLSANDFGISRSVPAVKNGRTWELVDHKDGVLFVVKARTLTKLAKRWAKKLGVWADDIRVTKEY